MNMDPNFHSFQSWKNSRTGASFLNNSDMSELQKSQASTVVNQPHAKTVYKAETYNNFSNINSSNNNHNQNNHNLPRKYPWKISFQWLSQSTVDITCDSQIPIQVINILKEFKSKYNRQTKAWETSFSVYSHLYNTILKLKVPNETFEIKPITLLPLNCIFDKEQLSVLKFTKINNNKKETTIIDYTHDPVYSIYQLPPTLLSTLYKFQKDGIDYGIKAKGRFLLADEMGVGKTIQAIGISAVFKNDWPVLVLCPSSLKLSWRDEIKNWLKDLVSVDEIQVVKKAKEEFRDSIKFYIVSYDWSVRISQTIEKKNFKFVIADEAHYLKNKDSKRSVWLIPVLQKAKRSIILSGTPILARPVEAYPLLNALRPDLFHSFKEFAARYCNPIQRIYGIDYTGSSNSRELHYILSKYMIRRLKTEVLAELPPKKRQKVEIPTDKKIVNQIKVLLKKSKVNLENENFVQKLNELSNPIDGGNKKDSKKGDYDEDDQHDDSNELGCFTKAYCLTGKSKIAGIQDYVTLLLDNSCKFLIFAHHWEVLEAIESTVKKAKIEYIKIYGKVNIEQRHSSVLKFQTDPNCWVAILGITACATGLTLTKASTVVFAELHFTPAVMMQAEDRAHRIGQEHECVNVHYLYASDTVDEIVFTKLKEKQMVVSSTWDNKILDLDVEKTKEKVGEFHKGNASTKPLVEIKEETKIKTLKDYYEVINWHEKNMKKERISVWEKKENLNKENDENDENDESYNKTIKIYAERLSTVGKRENKINTKTIPENKCDHSYQSNDKVKDKPEVTSNEKSKNSFGIYQENEFEIDDKTLELILEGDGNNTTSNNITINELECECDEIDEETMRQIFGS